MTEEVAPVTTPAAPVWFIDDGIPGVGERPTWLNEKFKTVSDLAKSYHELEKKIGMPPEEYDLSKSKFIDPAYVPFQEFAALAKEKKVPKEVVDKLVDTLDKYMDEFSTDYSEELTKLGENGKERIKLLDNWAKTNLSPTSYEAITNNLKSADAIKALEEVRNKMMSNNIVVPNGNDSDNLNVETVAQVEKEMADNYSKYKTDGKYRAEISSRFEKASKSGNFVDKVGF